ncbi:MAG: NfeD family protein [Nitrosomonadales bacterium]|nr:NfeD family protein [Nitrosomonadales bacterium]
MDFISWSVFGILFILAESALGSRYLLAVGLAFFYPALADLAGASGSMQLAAFCVGTVVHVLIVMVLRKGRSPAKVEIEDADKGQRVEVIEWLDESTARVKHRGGEWLAEKVDDGMPSASHGTILKAQYGRLLISTEQSGAEQA